ncbi:diguanylate cyclase [Pseudorhodobacter sp. E13]|uniref:dihydroneopterin aldolase n=1 Tax=Pseudorhodobacter sp. E13 TaxID=2487931 RepID=UPI000F8E4986|nr:dihydroneopterin aldolase [Pseudorhodobacter sp. E13]RUS58521.1 diguanylate cyclase [Pseudorhodobacter sp. E13]
MTSDPETAFGHPEERAAALAGADPLDRISVRDYVVEVEIGAFAQERGLRQKVRFNIVVEVLPVPQPLNDDVDLILSYDRLTEAVGHELQAERINLLETLAERVALRILREPQAVRAFVRIEKIDRGPYDLGVEIVRSKDAVTRAQANVMPRPRVVFLGAQVDVAAYLAQLGQDAALILTVAGLGLPVPRSSDAGAQRRIELLAMEQAAWAVSAQDARFFVVGTRTELDWAMRNGQISVWAPSRMVMDSVHPPQGDGLALAVWLAEALHAVELVVIGAPRPETKLPLRLMEA